LGFDGSFWAIGADGYLAILEFLLSLNCCFHGKLIKEVHVKLILYLQGFLIIFYKNPRLGICYLFYKNNNIHLHDLLVHKLQNSILTIKNDSFS